MIHRNFFHRKYFKILNFQSTSREKEIGIYLFWNYDKKLLSVNFGLFVFQHFLLYFHRNSHAMVPWSNILNTEKSFSFKEINVRKFVAGSLRLVWWDPINWKSTDSKKVKTIMLIFPQYYSLHSTWKLKFLLYSIIVHYYYPIYKKNYHHEILERYCHKTTQTETENE